MGVYDGMNVVLVACSDGVEGLGGVFNNDTSMD